MCTKSVSSSHVPFIKECQLQSSKVAGIVNSILSDPSTAPVQYVRNEIDSSL